MAGILAAGISQQLKKSNGKKKVNAIAFRERNALYGESNKSNRKFNNIFSQAIKRRMKKQIHPENQGNNLTENGKVPKVLIEYQTFDGIHMQELHSTKSTNGQAHTLISRSQVLPDPKMAYNILEKYCAWAVSEVLPDPKMTRNILEKYRALAVLKNSCDFPNLYTTSLGNIFETGLYSYFTSGQQSISTKDVHDSCHSLNSKVSMTQSANLMEAEKLKKNAEVQETREDDIEYMHLICPKYTSHVCGTEFQPCSISNMKTFASSIFEEDEAKLINEDRDECEVSIESFMIDNSSSDYEAGSDDSLIMICVVETNNQSAHTELNFVNTQFIRVPIIDEALFANRHSEKSKISRDMSQEKLNPNFNHVDFRKEDQQREGSIELRKNQSIGSSNNMKLLWNKIKIDSERNEFEDFKEIENKCPHKLGKKLSSETMNRLNKSLSHQSINSKSSFTNSRKEDQQREIASKTIKKSPSRSSSNNAKIISTDFISDSGRTQSKTSLAIATTEEEKLINETIEKLSNETMNGRLNKSLSHQSINSKSSFTNSRKEDQQREKASKIIKKSPSKSSSNNAKIISTDFISESESNQSETSMAIATSEEEKLINETINEQLNDSLYKENRCVHSYSGIAHISENLQTKSFQIINNSRENIGKKPHSKDMNLNVINDVNLDMNNLGGKSSKFQNVACIENQKEIGREAQQINIDSSFFIRKNKSLMSEQPRTFDDRTDYDSEFDAPSLFDGLSFRTSDDRSDYESVVDTPSLFDGLSSESEGLDKGRVSFEPSVQITNYSPNSYSCTNKLERKGEDLEQPEEIKMEAKNVTTEEYLVEQNTGDNRCGTSNSEKTKEKSETFSSVINYIDDESYNSMLGLD